MKEKDRERYIHYEKDREREREVFELSQFYDLPFACLFYDETHRAINQTGKNPKHGVKEFHQEIGDFFPRSHKYRPFATLTPIFDVPRPPD